MKVKVTQFHSTLCDPMDYAVDGILQARILEWVAFPFSRWSSQPRDWSQSATLLVDSLPAEPQGKSKNTRVGSLSFLQQIFLTQELNQGLLHCRWILYQLSYQLFLYTVFSFYLSSEACPKCLSFLEKLNSNYVFEERVFQWSNCFFVIGILRALHK